MLHIFEQGEIGMENDLRNSGASDELSRFLTKDDVAAQMRDEAAVTMAKQVQEWSKDNLNRFDDNGNERVNMGELDLARRTAESREDAQALTYLQENYRQIEKHSQNKFLFIKGAGGLSTDGMGEFVSSLEKQREENAQALTARLNERKLQSESAGLASGLLANSGNPNQSLFRVIDSLDGDIDNEISKRDLGRYLDEYQKRARYGDVGTGFFTPETRRYVENLKANWDKESTVRLRGTHTSRSHDGRDEQVANSDISEKSLKAALGVDKHGDVFAKFAKAPLQSRDPVVRMADTSGEVADSAPAKTAKPAEKVDVVEPPKAVRARTTAQADTAATEKPAAKPQPAEVAAPKIKADKPAGEKAVKVQAPAPKPEVKPEQSARSARSNGSNPFASAEPMEVSSHVAKKIKDNFFQTELYHQETSASARAAEQSSISQAFDLHEWGKDNLPRFDMSGDNRLNFGETDLGIRTATSERDREKLTEISDNFKKIQEQSGGGFLFIERPDAVSMKDLRVNVEKQQERAQANEEARLAAESVRRDQARNSHLAAGLLSTADGNPNRSLFRVIDGLDNDMDHEISKRDLSRYLDEYQKRSRYGDVGKGHFSQESRRYVEFLHQNWDSKDVVALRGSYTDNEHRTRTHSDINLERLSKMLGLSKNDSLFRHFSATER